ncbi:DUF4236 domain-containing protein [Ideonella sp. B508-1]|uniref:DUF4236 domain-containing protein n=1 Tax=Ideonella sp. B508-1 TaxID=137716 RepID=UPI0009FD910D|nr:DUF4236 domain-containing protein [Ideonella sp. B508-1]
MGVTFSKSIRFGAVRFNFSGSGIGVSAGIPGLRIGAGPRGAYISGGVGGFRYRKSLGARSSPVSTVGTPARPPSTTPAEAPTPQLHDGPSPTVVGTVEHNAKDVLELADSNGDALLQSMNEQRSRQALWPFAAVGLFVAFLLFRNMGQSWPTAVHLVVAGLFAVIVGWVKWRDGVQRLTVLFFEPDAKSCQVFEQLTASTRTAAEARKLRSVANTAQYADTKYTGGAAQGLKFEEASFSVGQPPGVASNVDVPLLRAGRTLLAFFPDRVLAFQGKSVGAIDYHRLEVASRPSQFIEHESLPSDARVIEHTWQYVNKKGGPDKRFKNNRQLPVCAYNALHLSTPDGLDLRFMASKEGCFDAFAQTVKAIHRQR